MTDNSIISANDILAQNYNPYYNDFDRTKACLQVLFKPGVPVQARELTQLQSILQHQIASLAGYLLEDGNVVDGLGIETFVDNWHLIDERNQNNIPINISNLQPGTYETDQGRTVEIFGVDEENFYIYTDIQLSAAEQIETNIGTVRITSGQDARVGTAYRVCVNEGLYFLADRFVTVPKEVFYPVSDTILYEGKLGYIYNETIVTAKDDNTLNNPAKGTYGYSGEGADRLKLNTELKFYQTGETIPDGFLELACLEDGEWIITANTPFMDGPDYTNVSVDFNDDRWVINVTGNDQNLSAEINLCDIIEGNISDLENPTIAVSGNNSSGDCVNRRIEYGQLIPQRIDAFCSGSEPDIDIGQYWLDVSSLPFILRLKESDVLWEDIDPNNLNSLSRVDCTNTDASYIIRNGAWVDGSVDNSLANTGASSTVNYTTYRVCFEDEEGSGAMAGGPSEFFFNSYDHVIAPYDMIFDGGSDINGLPWTAQSAPGQTFLAEAYDLDIQISGPNIIVEDITTGAKLGSIQIRQNDQFIVKRRVTLLTPGGGGNGGN